jgi:O-methyltransferase involved in polyketide biosynthesis
MGIALPDLTPAEESLFLTLGSRALDSRLRLPFLGDTASDEILTGVGYNLAKFPQLSSRLIDRRSKVFDVAVRTKIMDEMVREFIRREPNAVVLDLGAGLDGRISRVNPPPSVQWYDIDFPAVAALRQELLPPSYNEHIIGADVTDPGWLPQLPGDRPAMIVADGLVLFLAQDRFLSLLNRLTAQFPGGELVFNSYTSYALRTLKRSRAMRAISGGIVSPGMNDPMVLEELVDGLTLLEEVFLTRAPEVAELPLITRSISRLAARSATLSRMTTTVVVRYRF